MNDIERIHSAYLAHPAVQTDTRKLRAGEIFFALKGPNFNGNSFARQALDAGAAAVVVDEDQGITDPRLFLVADALKALQDLALEHRKTLKIPVLAITGSNGKTTTKELIHAVLSTTFRTSTTQGNLNNQIGVPLTLLAIKPDAEIAVVELGANHQLEIEGYCRYTLPTHGIITNNGKDHLEGYGSIEGVRKGNGELYDHLRTHGGVAFVMTDYDDLRNMSAGISRIVSYGTHDAQITGIVHSCTPLLEVLMTGGTGSKHIPTRLIGDYNLPNVLAAVAVGEHFGVDEEKIASAISSYQPSNNRSQLVHRGTNKIFLDAYNANPSSMQAAIENFARQHDPGKVLVLGGMAEMGDASLDEHAGILALIGQHAWKDVILVGGDFDKLSHRYRFFPDSASARDWLSTKPWEDTYFLVKGSRSMRMETVLEGLGQ